MRELASSTARPSGRYVQITNQDRGTVLAQQASRARNLIARTVGLMGAASLAEGAGLYLDGDNAIHTCFMRFPIDVAFVDDQLRVVHLMHRLRPWRMSRIVWRARGVLELPPGTLGRTGTQLGDRLTLAAAV